MAKTFEQRLETTRAAALEPQVAAHRAHLLKTLGGKQGYLISVAAGAITGPDAALSQAAGEAFERLCEDPIKRDPQCHGKTAIARALFDNDLPADDVFLRGATHVQMEPVLGGRQDTAAELRGICAMALVHAQHPRAITTAAALLADPERAAKLAAIRAIAASGQPELVEPILRLKLEAGDEDAEVITDCMTELLRAAPDQNLPLIAARIGAEDLVISQSAALAIGASGAPGALDALVACTDQIVTSERRATVLLAIAMLRSDASSQHLIELVMDGTPAEAQDAISALATFKHQPDLAARVEAAVVDRGEAPILSHFERSFAANEPS